MPIYTLIKDTDGFVTKIDVDGTTYELSSPTTESEIIIREKLIKLKDGTFDVLVLAGVLAAGAHLMFQQTKKMLSI